MEEKLVIYSKNEHLPGPAPSKEIRKNVLDSLSDKPKTIKDIAEEANTTRITAKKHLEALKRLGKAKEVYRNATLRLFIFKKEKNRRCKDEFRTKNETTTIL